MTRACDVRMSSYTRRFAYHHLQINTITSAMCKMWRKWPSRTTYENNCFYRVFYKQSTSGVFLLYRNQVNYFALINRNYEVKILMLAAGKNRRRRSPGYAETDILKQKYTIERNSIYRFFPCISFAVWFHMLWGRHTYTILCSGGVG